jgi:hypothetical protein
LFQPSLRDREVRRAVAEPDMVLTIRYDDAGDVETFLLGGRGADPVAVNTLAEHPSRWAPLRRDYGFVRISADFRHLP